MFSVIAVYRQIALLFAEIHGREYSVNSQGTRWAPLLRH
jgi:hypothetical protein